MYRQPPTKRPFGWNDIVVLAAVALLIYGLIGVAQHWTGQMREVTEIDLSPRALPKYAFFSLMRAIAAYFLSLGFSVAYGYAAARIRRAERVMISFLDILQAIPVLGFLPGLILALVSLFPHSNVGLELTCVLTIFTGQAWNMCFSFYTSMKTIPGELNDVSRVMQLTWWQRMKEVEVPFAAIGLAWNSLMSMAGGWFFLTICESFTLGDRKFQVPGIGSYMATAIENNDRRAMVFGVLAMCFVIVFCDFVIWRPVMAWVRKFQMEEIQEEVADLPFMTTLLRESWVMRQMKLFAMRWARRRAAKPHNVQNGTPPIAPTARLTLAQITESIKRQRVWGGRVLSQLAAPAMIVFCLWGGTRLWELVRTLTMDDWKTIWAALALSFARIFVAVAVSSMWTIPAAIIIGLSPRLTRFFQPIVQVLASLPAPMIFPLVLAVLFRFGVTLHWGAAVLIMISVQWYILFNVLAGAMSVTRELKDTMKLIGVRRRTLWWRLYLPSAFPALVTGWITAAGGAWNASIVAEYIHFGGKTYTANGIGALISRATESGNFPMLAGCLITMVLAVVGLNQTWWRWLHEQAETRFRFER
jgi:NitT/TauT family transport system permease protein